MIRLKYKFVRDFDEIFNEQRLIDDIVKGIQERLSKEGRVIEDNLGYGFRIEFGKPQTLRELLHPSSYWDSKPSLGNMERLREIIG